MNMRAWLPWLVAFAIGGVLAAVSWRETVPTARASEPVLETTDPISWISDSPLKEQYGGYAFHAFEKNPDLAERIGRVRPKFDPNELGTSVPTRFARLAGGRSFAIIKGCRQHDCPSYQAVIAIEDHSQKIYVMESEFTGAGKDSKVTIWGEPDEAVRGLLTASLLPQ